MQTFLCSALLYGSKMLFLYENEIGMMQRTERTMMRALFGLKLVYWRKNVRS